MLVMNLLQSLLGRAVQLEFHHIDKLVSLQDKVNASFTRMIFHLGIEADKLEYDEKHILVMQFLFTDNLVCSVCKEALQALEERIVVAGTYFTDKLLYLKWRFNVVHAGIIRYKKLYEPFFHFFVWKAQMIDTELFIISFYSKISTLIDNRNGTG